MGQAFESSGNLPDAVLGIVRRATLNRVAIDDGPQHEGVVGIQPERQLSIARQPGDIRGAQLADVSVEFRPVAPECPVVDEAVAHVKVEQLIER